MAESPRSTSVGVVAIALATLVASACSGDEVDSASDGSAPATAGSDASGRSGSRRPGAPTSSVPGPDAPGTAPATQADPVSVRLDVESQFLGFAGTQGLTGGLGKPVVLVTTTDDSGPGSYREALTGGDRIVRFDPSLDGETIHLRSPVAATGDDLTLDGSGVDVTVSGHATRFSGTNIVVAGMAFRDNDDVESVDAITFRDADETQIAGVFGNRFEHAADGLVDVIWNGGHDVHLTMCGNSFAHHDKAVLIDSGDDEREGGTYHVSLCHNTWTDVYQRTPLSRRALVHQFNSLFERYGKPDGNGGGSKAGGHGSDGSQHLLEHNIAVPRQAGERTFDGTTVTDPRAEWAGTQHGSDAAVRTIGTLLGSLDGVMASELTERPSEVFSPPYEYPLVEASARLAEVLRATAGVCVPVGAERVSPCAPLVLRDDRSGTLDVVVDGGEVESVIVVAGASTIDAELVEPGRWAVTLAAMGDGPTEVRAEVRLADGRSTWSDVAVVALVP
jgi:pectate lyase